MNKSVFKNHLEAHPDAELVVILPSGRSVPAHAHVTEVGRVEKRFIDCGGTRRSAVTTNLQAWVDTDIDHRLQPGKLAAIIDLAAPLFGSEDPEVEIEYEDAVISQYPVEHATAANGKITFQLASKHTDCLAKDVCLPASADAGNSCCGSTGCC